ncbi:MAG: flagellin [Deltaproteobacteria bacterium]|nr:flagellin [Deltaproteobacteria bacterium]RLB90383.1 MAG: flagellin [Deltaproteobacteria bacterium]RLC11954.1 MAG: flagellin [Deltaproteobacteria bacterium]
MGLRIQTNVAALNAHRQLGISDANLSKSLERLSSGYRINKAADDAAGLAIAGKLRVNVKSYVKASENTAQAIAMVQVAEGAMDQIENIVNRLKELATQAASANTDTDGRSRLNDEFTTLKNEIDRIANSTKYGGTDLIHGTFGAKVDDMTSNVASKGIAGTSSIDVSAHIGDSDAAFTIHDTADNTITLTNGTITQTVTLSDTGAQTINFDKLGVKVTVDNAYDDNSELNNVAFTCTNDTQYIQVGTTNDSNDYIAMTMGNMDTDQNYGGGSALSGWSISTVTAAQNALNSIDAAIAYVAQKRGDLGAIQNRLGYAAANLATTIENTQAAESTIRDVDMAAEMTSFTKNQILLQAGTAMLAQANMAPQQVLALFG